MVNHSCTADLGSDVGGAPLAERAGLFVLGRFFDALGLGAALSAGYGAIGERAPGHGRGKALCQAMLVFADGGEAVSDIESLRAAPGLFGSVPSASTLYRAARGVDAGRLEALRGAFAGVRERVWPKIPAAAAGEVVIDIDSSVHEVHSENKAGAAPHYKRGFGFHAMYAFADCTGECLSALLRPGNAAANSIADHAAVLDAAIDALPAGARAGHRAGDDASAARRRVRVRADSAGCTGFVWACTARNVGFSVTARSDARIDTAISASLSQRWRRKPAQRPGRRRARRGREARVAELTDLVDTASWPPGTRLIVRREPRHQGAQRSLLASERWRYWGHWTNQPGSAAERDADMRAHSRVEDHIARLKDSGAGRFPFRDLNANRAWHQLAAHADAAVRWLRQTCLSEPLRRARPKTLRRNLWHTGARLVRHARRHTVRLPDASPAAGHLVQAAIRVNLLI